MPEVTIPYAIEVTIKAHNYIDGTTLEHVLGCVSEDNASPTPTDVQNAAQSVAVAIGDNLPVWSSIIRFQSVHARSLRGSFSDEFTVDIDGTQGTDVNAALPCVLACVITLRSDFIGRARRGRIYGFGSTITDLSPLNPDLWTVDWTNEYIAFLVAVQTQWGLHTLLPAIISKRTRGFVLITSMDSDSVVRVQRRRELGHGV